MVPTAGTKAIARLVRYLPSHQFEARPAPGNSHRIENISARFKDPIDIHTPSHASLQRPLKWRWRRHTSPSSRQMWLGLQLCLLRGLGTMQIGRGRQQGALEVSAFSSHLPWNQFCALWGQDPIQYCLLSRNPLADGQ